MESCTQTQNVDEEPLSRAFIFEVGQSNKLYHELQLQGSIPEVRHKTAITQL